MVCFKVIGWRGHDGALGRSGGGYSCAGGLRWRREDRHRSVPQRPMVCFKVIGWRGHDGGLGRSGAGYSCAGGLRWRWESGYRSVPQRPVVCFKVIGWRGHGGGLGRSGAGYSAKLNAYVTRRDEILVEIKKAKGSNTI